MRSAAVIVTFAVLGSFWGARECRALQSDLADTAGRIRDAWLRHDMRAVVSGPDPVEIRLPNSRPSRPLAPAQAAALLASFVDDAEETEFDLRVVRQTGDDLGYAEALRKFVVSGTSEELGHTVFLGFQRVESIWRLTEIRFSPE